jgi:hypothetical protein
MTTRQTLKRRAKRLAENPVERPKEAKHEIVVQNPSQYVKKRLPVVEERMKIMGLAKHAVDEEERLIKQRRVPYARMRAHMEVAAIVLAAGGTRKMAAAKAGVTLRQIQKYLGNPDFRARVAELQELTVKKILGKVVKEIDRRTDPKVIKKMELMDLLRVGDRVGLGRGNGNTVVNDNSQTTSYEATFNALIFPDSEKEGADFPEFEPTDLALSGGDSPVDG